MDISRQYQYDIDISAFLAIPTSICISTKSKKSHAFKNSYMFHLENIYRTEARILASSTQIVKTRKEMPEQQSKLRYCKLCLFLHNKLKEGVIQLAMKNHVAQCSVCCTNVATTLLDSFWRLFYYQYILNNSHLKSDINTNKRQALFRIRDRYRYQKGAISTSIPISILIL